jgi:acetyl esterase/lipase
MRHECIDIKVDYKKAEAIQDGYQPKLYTYILDESEELIHSHRRAAVIICPGGAYRFKSDREAEVVAIRYLSAGNQAFVLQYSVAPSRYPSAMLELAEAVAYVRSHADEYCINPDKIVITGFSAGGHLAACLGNLWDDEIIEKTLGVKYPVENGRKLWKPDGMILCYPVVTMGEFTHEESRELLLGADYTEEMAYELSMENRVSDRTVPAFLWHTQEDDAVPVENSLQLATALRRHKIPFELHIFEKGCHGLSLCEESISNGEFPLPADSANSMWMDMALLWMRRL